MKIKVADSAGFCIGVKRAFELTEKILKKYNYKNIFATGEIVHNSSVTKYFNNKNLKIVKDLSKIPNDSVLIIRAHGIEDNLRNKIIKRNIKYYDATCPYVAKFKLVAEKLEKEGYFIIIFGDKEHAEIKTITSNIKNFKILSTIEEFERLGNFGDKKIALLSQTTQSVELFKEVVKILVDKTSQLFIFNTICDATKKRQNAAVRLAKEVDIMIVLGSKNSANSFRLYSICKEINPETYMVDNIYELDKNVLKGKNLVGITAGASTPDWIINEAVHFLKNFEY